MQNSEVSLVSTVALSVALFFVGRCQAELYGESPMLRTLVEQGKLPPVQQRLPEKPAVVQPYEKTGVYGGTMRTITPTLENLDEAGFMVLEPLLRFVGDGVRILPNVVTHWEMSKDAKSITLFLRKGMRWSDGVPVTVEDVLFAWYDIIRNEDINPPSLLPAEFKAGGKPMEVERVDDFTFRLVFAEPYGAVTYALTRTIDAQSLLQPKHYLKHYHPKYTPMKEIMAEARQAGFANWFELFRSVNYPSRLTGRLSPRTPPDFPTIGAWHVAEVPSTGHAILQRNPYYWKIDPEGNQLPYIDRIHSTYIGGLGARNLQYISGNVDLAAWFTRLENTPLFLSNRRKGGYKVYFWRENQGTRVAYYFNQTHRDPVLRKIFQDRRFRIALSLAIDRKEINDIVYFGKCMPRQDTVDRVCSFFQPDLETAYVQYDPDQANRMLDEMGLKRKGVGGWRHRPDGRQLTLYLDLFNWEPYMKTAQLVQEYWREVGVVLNWRIVSGSLQTERVLGNSHDLVGYSNGLATDVMVLSIPLLGIDLWAPLWAKWLRTEGEQGEEPPQQITDAYRAWQDLRRTPDPQERIRLGKKLVRTKSDNLWGIGTVGAVLNPIIVSNRLHNVPQFMKDKDGNLVEGQRALWDYSWLGTFLHHPEQFYIRED